MEPPKIGEIRMFPSPFSISILKNSEEWFLDGTFEIVKLTLFAQLYVVVARAPRSNLKIPCVFALLPDKTKATYMIMFKKLEDLGVTGPMMAHIEFELGVYSSLKKVFPHSDLAGCDVHWKRNLRDNMREVGLVKYSNTELAV